MKVTLHDTMRKMKYHLFLAVFWPIMDNLNVITKKQLTRERGMSYFLKWLETKFFKNINVIKDKERL